MNQAEICLFHTGPHLLSLYEIRQCLPISLINPVIPIQQSVIFNSQYGLIWGRGGDRVNTNYLK